jgi:hypothetical protein
VTEKNEERTNTNSKFYLSQFRHYINFAKIIIHGLIASNIKGWTSWNNKTAGKCIIKIKQFQALY